MIILSVSFDFAVYLSFLERSACSTLPVDSVLHRLLVAQKLNDISFAEACRFHEKLTAYFSEHPDQRSVV